MIEILKNYFPNIKIIKKERDKLVPLRGTLSTQKARELLGYKPKWSLNNGYPKYIEWYKKIFNS